MTSVAIKGFPRHKAVVALAAEFPVHYLCHGDVICASLQYEDILVTDLALKSYPVEPVREDHRFDLGFSHAFGFAFKHYVSVFGKYRNRHHGNTQKSCGQGGYQ